MLYLFLFILFIGLFIFGMTILRTGLFNVSARSLKTWLTKLTDTAWKGMLIGTAVTGILQSSSAVMVMTIGLISAGILTFRQSIGIILGTNIGTTFTTEFITFDIDVLLLPFAISGVLLLFFKSRKMKSMGYILLGLAAIFSAMRGFEYLASPLTSIPFVLESINHINDSKWLSVVSGTLITAIIQSSTATTGITMSFLSNGIINIGSGIALMLGANIGTCITGYIASIGGGYESKLCAYAHIWLNILGVLIFFPMIDYLASFAATLSGETDVQLAHVSLIFNVLSSLIALPFASKFGNFIVRLHGKGRPV